MRGAIGETKILYVDDEPANLTIFRRQFRNTMQVRTASSGTEALDILASEEIPVLLTDQKMPRMTGAELATEVRRRHPDVIRMVVTAYADFDAVVRSINDGQVTRYIRKPWNAAELRTIITTACELYWTTKQNRVLTEDLLHHKRLGAVAAMAQDLTGQLESIGSSFGAIDRLERTSPDAGTDIAVFHGAVSRLTQMIDDLRQYSKRYSFDRSALAVRDLNVMVEKSVELLRLFPAIQSLSSLKVDRCAEYLPVEVDAPRLTQVLVNLVFNLVSDNARPSGEVVLATRAEGNQGVVSFLGSGARLSLDASSLLAGGVLAFSAARGGLWLLLGQRVLNDYRGRLRLSSRGELELSIPLTGGEPEESL